MKYFGVVKTGASTDKYFEQRFFDDIGENIEFFESRVGRKLDLDEWGFIVQAWRDGRIVSINRGQIYISPIV